MNDHKENTSKALSGEEVKPTSDANANDASAVEAGIESLTAEVSSPTAKNEVAPATETIADIASEVVPVEKPKRTKTASRPKIATIEEVQETVAHISSGADLPETEEEEDHEVEELLDENQFEGMEIDALVQHFMEAVKSDNLQHVKNKVFTLKNLIETHFDQDRRIKLASFLEEGNEADDFAPVPNPFHLLYLEHLSRYSERRHKEKENRDQQLQLNFTKREELLEKLRVLVESEEQHSHDILKEIQAQWKDVGTVAINQRREQWQRYHFLIDKFYDNLRINRELKELDLHKNLEAKTELCERAEELLLEQSLKKAIDTLNQLHEHWKQLGPVPREQKETIWERFKSASDKIYDKRKAYFHVLDGEREQNLAKKEALCLKVEALVAEIPKEHNGWQRISEAVEAIQAEWKSVGFAPKAQNTSIWKRFKDACDHVYQAKNQFYKDVRQDQLDNLNKKSALCEQAEALESSEDWKSSTDALIRLQKEWKKVGPVPKKYSDKIWKRFRTACDNFFNRKNEHFSSQDKGQEDNLAKKLALITQIESFVGSGNANADLEQLKAFQREWLEIGFIPLKDKKDVQEKYRTALNAHFDTLKVSHAEKSKMNFQNKVEAIKNDKDGDKLMRKEHFQIQNRINGLSNDITLWENNMEFFTASKNSKNADLLKQEIEQKIIKAKAEIAELKQKLAILREV